MNYFDNIQKITQSFLTRESSSNIVNLWNLFAGQLMEIEAQLDLMRNVPNITQQAGLVLDQLGTNLNSTRPAGMADNSYKSYLTVGMEQYYCGGTPNELIDIGDIVAGYDSESEFNPVELWMITAAHLLDGNKPLDATQMMDPGQTTRFGTVYGYVTGNILNIVPPSDVAAAINLVRAAGVRAEYYITFMVLASACTHYGGLAVKTAAFIAIGTGSTGPPGPGDTGLTTEVLRAGLYITPGIQNIYALIVFAPQLVGTGINELALFNAAGTMILKYTFPTIIKGTNEKYIFAIKDLWIDRLNLSHRRLPGC
jgi:hypothetical protein